MIFGSYILFRLATYLDYGQEYVYCCCVFAITSVLTAFVSIIFERKIKIIFGYLLSIINAALLFCILHYESVIVLYSYFALNLLIMAILMKMFLNDKVNIKGLIKKQRGFLIERIHIYIFEELTNKIAVVLKFIDEKIVQNILNCIIIVINYFINLLNFKPLKKDILINIWMILAVVSIFAFFAIFLTLFTKTWEV